MKRAGEALMRSGTKWRSIGAKAINWSSPQRSSPSNMSITITPINTVSRTQQVVDQLTQSIISGELATDSILMPERELAEQMGVSRTVVREATKVLQSRGLLTIRQGTGTIVTGVTSGPMQDVLSHTLHNDSPQSATDKLTEIRVVLECEVARLAARRATKKQVAAMRQVLADAAGRMDDAEAWMELDDQFHHLLAQSTSNELFVVTLDSMRDVTRKVRAIAFAMVHPIEPQQAHEEILRAIADGRSEEAARLMRGHINFAEDEK